MIEELNLTMGQCLLLMPVLIILTVLIWRLESHTEQEIHSEGKTTTPPLNERYGAYIQLAGKRYN